MSTNFDPAFVQNLTGLNPNPIIRLLELTVEDTPVLERLADSNQDVLFHGITFQRFGMTIDGLDPGSVEDPERVTIVVQNIDGVVTSLCENFWVGNLDPVWLLKVWYVDETNPNLTAIGDFLSFQVESIDTDLLICTFNLNATPFTQTRLIPGRNL